MNLTFPPGIRTRSAAAILVAAVALSACGSSAKKASTAGTSPTTTSTGATPASAVVAASANPTYGTVLIDAANGDTLYLLTSEAGGKVKCSGPCLAIWPPLTSATDVTPRSPAGVAGTLGVISRSGGQQQVTDNGYPLYRYAADTTGQSKGQGIHAFGGVWTVVSAAATSPASTPVTASTPSSTTTTHSGYGY